MNTLCKFSLALIFLSVALFAQTNPMYWQTTHTTNWHSNGDCILQENKVLVTVNAFTLDVEEEATIVTTGAVSAGDPSTLEIVGEFELTPGSVVRSMLLWNGTKILKAKLKDRAAADSAYEQVVDRDRVVFVSRDPALIENIGLNTYRYKIYPVAINGSRKIRILYSVPLQASNNSPFFEFKTAFTNGTNQTPPKISFKINKNGSVTGSYLIKYGSIQKTVQFGSTYSIPATDLMVGGGFNVFNATIGRWYWDVRMPASIMITMDTTNLNRAYSFHSSTGSGAGYYAAIFATTPTAFVDYVNQLNNNSTTLFELKVNAGTESVIENVPYVGGFGVCIKSSVAWDHKIYWTAYNETGHIVAQCSQTIIPDSTSEITSVVPLFWAAKYCFKENSGNLGALYGFVDRKMSLLALERDSLPKAIAAVYSDAGVPPLLPEEIIFAQSDAPVAPQNSVLFEFTPVKTSPTDATRVFAISIMPHGMLSICTGTFLQGMAEIKVFNLSGRLVFQKNIFVNQGQIQVQLPGNLKGVFVMRVVMDKKVEQRHIVVR